MDSIVVIRQLANRLECATSTGERIDTLQELQNLAKQHPFEVGKHCIQLLIDLLKEQGSTEEYQEALDLIYRLIKCPKDIPAATANSELILLQKADNIELLLELLEHKDMVVGITTSQILTEIHSRCGSLLERAIQDCHTGMNKLLQRLPDSSKEEIRNQAIVLVQQLTANNEEMKKTVAFNEGFDILFGIVQSEGGALDAGMVTQDCLVICSNILSDSETCQRLFYEMGSGWFLKLADFFDPSILETAVDTGLYDDTDAQDEFTPTVWFEQPSRMSCAVYALTALSNSLSMGNKKYQNMIGVSSSNLLTNAAFWLARRGPLELITPALELLSRTVSKNELVRSEVVQALIKLPPSKRDKNIHASFDFPASHFLVFGWKPLPKDELKFITIPSLLAEQVIFQGPLWSSKYEQTTVDIEQVSQTCMSVLETIFSVDTTFASVMLQYVLAPPPPSIEDDDISTGNSGSMETMKPLVALILNTIVDAYERFINSSKGNFQVPDYSIIERSCNILTLLFVHSDSLARELLTAISTGHTSLATNAAGPFTSQQILPFLLASAGKAIRLQNGYTVVTAILRLLAVAITDCDRAVRQVLENPSNLFVLDLATSASDGAGVPIIVQTVACFFLGIAFLSIKDVTTATTESSLTQRSFLLMIDGRIGLTRFSDILKRPLVLTPASAAVHTELFLSPSFKIFYESKVDLVRRSLFDYYASSGNSTDNSEKTPEQQIIDLQKNHITELESELKILKSQKKDELIHVDDSRIFALEKELKSGEGKILALQNILAEKEAALESMLQSEAAILAEAEALRARADYAEAQLYELKQRESKLLLSSTEGSSSGKEDALSAKVLKLEQENDNLKKEVAQKNQKIVNLEESLRSPMGFESLRESRIKELEVETEALRVQLADSDSTVKAITLAANAKLDNVDELTSERLDFFNTVDSSFNKIAIVANNLAEITSMEALDCMISLNGLPVNLDGTSSYKLKASVFSEKMNILHALLQEMISSTRLLAGTCSDMAEGAGFDSGSFTQPEGTAYRIRECANMLASRLHEASEDLGELERYRSELQISDTQRSSLQDEIFRLTELVASLQQSISVQDSTGAIDIQEELAAEKTANRAREAEIDGLKLVISNLQSHDHLVAMANSSIDNREHVIQSLRQELMIANDDLTEVNRQLSEKTQELLGVLSELNEIKDRQSELVNSKDSEINQLQQALRSSENQCKELETTNNEQEEVIAGLEGESKAKDEQIQSIVDNSLQAMKLELAEKEAKVVELNCLIDKFFSEKKVLEEQLSTIKAIAAGLEKELEEAKTNLSTTLTNYEDHKDLSVSVLAIDASAARAESSEMARLSQELSRAESAVRSKDKELLAALQESSAAAGKISGLQIALRDVSEELEAVRKENLSLEKRLISQRGTHDLLKQEADEVNEAVRKSADEVKNKDKVILTLRQELALVGEELKDSNRELLEKTRDIFETQNLNLQYVDDIADFVSWFHDILLSSVVDDSSLRKSMMSDFNQLILNKKASDGNPVSEIISLTKESVKGNILSLESKVEESRECLKLKESELAQVKEKLEKAFADMKRQMASTMDDSMDMSAQATPAKAFSVAKTPASGSGSGSVAMTPSKWQEASNFINSLTPEAKAAAKYHSDLLKKQRMYDELQEEHTDLLSLLAQQELELGVFRSKMSKLSGLKAVKTTEEEARTAAIEKYGTYTEFRSN